MKVTTLKKTSLHAIPLIIFTMLMLLGTHTYASVPNGVIHKNNLPAASSTQGFIQLAKGQSYVPPKKKCRCCEEDS